MAPKNPKTVTVYGRLSFPSFTVAEAFALSQKGKYPAATPADATPGFQLLLEQPQFDKLLTHITDVFFPYCIEQEKAGEKRDVLSAAEVKKLTEGIKGDIADMIFNSPFKEMHEKTVELAPETVATLKVVGNKGVDIELKAIVQNEDELAVPDPDQLTYPCIKPIGQTVHNMYPGALVTVTLNLYAYHNDPKRPGFSAGASVAVFKADADRFGGGAVLDEDEMFMD